MSRQFYVTFLYNWQGQVKEILSGHVCSTIYIVPVAKLQFFEIIFYSFENVLALISNIRLQHTTYGNSILYLWQKNGLSNLTIFHTLFSVWKTKVRLFNSFYFLFLFLCKHEFQCFANSLLMLKELLHLRDSINLNILA